MQLNHVIIQDISTTETRTVLSGAMLLDHPVNVLHSSMAGLSSPVFVQALGTGVALPVGSVEFVREAMRLANIPEPANMSYPKVLSDFLFREVRQIRAGSVIGTWFVKPTSTKAFTGFVFDTLGDPDKLDEHDRVQYDAFMATSADTPVWISEPVEFLCEHRYYIGNGKVLGQGRYDADGADDAPVPDMAVVMSAAQAMGSVHCALDFGVLSTGETSLIECNDAWSIGLYERALRPRDYLQFLGARWAELLATKPMHAKTSDGGLETEIPRRSMRAKPF